MTQESNPGLHARGILYQLSYQRSLRPSIDFYKYYILGWEGGEHNQQTYLHMFTNDLHNFMNKGNGPIWIMQLWKLTTTNSRSNFGLGEKIVAHLVNNSPATQHARVQFLGREESQEKGMGAHSSILAWRVPQTDEPGRLQSIEWLTVPWDWGTATTENKAQPPTQLHLWQKRGNTQKEFSFSQGGSLPEIRSVVSNQNVTGSSVYGILQARILQWVTIPFPRNWAWVYCYNLGQAL